MVKDCVILHDALDKMSDHLAVSLTLKMDISTSIKSNNKADSNASSVHPRARWHDKCFQERYASVIEENLDKISIMPADKVKFEDAKHYVDCVYDQLCEAMHFGVASCSAVNNSTKGKKWWWNQDCLVMRNRNRLFHFIWKKSGKPDSGML